MPKPAFLTDEDFAQLIANGKRQDPVRGTEDEINFVPVVKLFTPTWGGTWLLTEIPSGDTDAAFGLCDLGLGTPECGYVDLQELAALRGPLNLGVERDRYFTTDKPLSYWIDEAKRAGRITA